MLERIHLYIFDEEGESERAREREREIFENVSFPKIRSNQHSACTADGGSEINPNIGKLRACISGKRDSMCVRTNV